MSKFRALIRKVDPPQGEYAYLVSTQKRGEAERQSYARDLEELRQLLPEVSRNGWDSITFVLSTGTVSTVNITREDNEAEGIFLE